MQSAQQTSTVKVTPDNITEFFMEGGTLSDLRGYDKKTMEGIYHVAYGKYQAGSLRDAEKIFEMLCMLDHYEKKYIFGLAACRHRLRKYKAAVEAYSLAAMRDIYDPQLPFLAGQCYMSLEEYSLAKQCFESVTEIASFQEEEDGKVQEEYSLKAVEMLKLIGTKNKSST